MKIVFLGPALTRARSDRRSRILTTLLEGVVDRGHHVLYVQPEGDTLAKAFPFLEFLAYGDWRSARDAVEAECAGASAICVVSGFPPGHEALEWLLELPVPARAYYDLDPWETIAGFESEGAAPWIRADQIPAFHIVFSIAGGPATDAFKSKWGAEEAVTLYEAIDPAIFHPRSPSDEVASDLLMLADKTEVSESALETYVLDAARSVPDRRFLVAGTGWQSATAWPDNVELALSGGADVRAMLYSSARLVLIPPSEEHVDNALPIDLLEAAACGSACAVIDRPGLGSLFKLGEEVLVPASPGDLLPLLTAFDNAKLLRIGNLAEKRVVADYSKLRVSTKFEQRLARKFFQGVNG